MCALAELENWPDVGVRFFTREEEKRILNFPIPGDASNGDRDYGDTAFYYPRAPREDVREYRKSHSERLRHLRRMAGM